METLLQTTQLERLKKLVKKELELLDAKNPDITIDIAGRKVQEKHRGEIKFNNCFILMDILVLLARSPGKTFSKDDLSQFIWKETYNPLIHDNKIYYNINRLRKLIEPMGKNGTYIMTSKDGYLFNKSVRVTILED